MNASVDMDQLDQALKQIGVAAGAAESHGTLAGLICARGHIRREEWLEEIDAPPPAAGDVLGRESLETLGRLYEQTVEQLAGPTLEFQPVLPDDSLPLSERAAALGDWCEGFLMGLSVGGVKDLEKLPADSAEVVNDLVAIARAGEYDLSEGEEEEVAYSELVEYVRAGVLLINEELNPTKAAPVGAPLH